MKKLIISLVFITVACATPAILTPAKGPGTPWPCGYTDVVCGDGTCCPEHHVCGHLNQGVDGRPFDGCAPHSCCFVGDE